jgi:hypothetical protein
MRSIFVKLQVADRQAAQRSTDDDTRFVLTNGQGCGGPSKDFWRRKLLKWATITSTQSQNRFEAAGSRTVKSAVLNTLTSRSSQRSYDHAIREFIHWYCSAKNKIAEFG